MLHWLAEYLTQYYSAFNVFSYLTFRAIVSTLTALFISLYFGPKLNSLFTENADWSNGT